ncbi:MAG: serine/threonine-protein kinase, partial [Myxococcota bacterium]|nr:serine/threonine-protein kinase [Myxococcota bacterium]
MPLVEVPGYRMIRVLGRGGMGTVFLAHKVSTGEPFAIKFLRQDCLEDPAYLGRFEREIAALRSIRHPNVVNVYAWSIPKDPESEDRPFVVMEYLDGDGLDRVLAREKTVSPLQAVRIMLQALDGLAAAHAIGVVHRDLGPSNVFLVPRPRGRFHVKILDFGLARTVTGALEHESDLTQRGTLMGKPAYVSPEMLTGQAVDGRCDIYACGVLLFRMLTGCFPYEESESHLLWIERLRGARSLTEYPPPSVLVPDLPASLDGIIARAMRAKIEDRYPNVEQMQEDLLEVENSLVDEHPSTADWSSSRPGIKAFVEPSADVSSRIGVRSRPAEATPTIDGIPEPRIPRRRRTLVAATAGAAAVALVALSAVLYMRLAGRD